MILLIINNDDFSSYEIIKLLRYYGSELIVLNNKNKIKDISVDIDNNKTVFRIRNEEFVIDIELVTSVFYRKGNISPLPRDCISW